MCEPVPKICDDPWCWPTSRCHACYVAYELSMKGRCSHPFCDNAGHAFNEDGDFWCAECLQGSVEEARDV